MNKSSSAPQTKLPSSLQRRLERHFLTCTAAVGAAAALAPAQDANATIIFFDPIDIQVPLNNAPGIYVNMETGAFGNSAGSVTGWDINIFNPSAVYLQTYVPNALTGVIGYTLGAYDYANRLSAGATIGPAGPFIFGGVTTMNYAGVGGQWTGTVNGFLGVTFQLADNSTVFGWMRIEVINGVDARITSWAYEDSGGAIMAGAIPEPSTMALGLLAAGAAGIGYWRRRKTAAA